MLIYPPILYITLKKHIQHGTKVNRKRRYVKKEKKKRKKKEKDEKKNNQSRKDGFSPRQLLLRLRGIHKKINKTRSRPRLRRTLFQNHIVSTYRLSIKGGRGGGSEQDKENSPNHDTLPHSSASAPPIPPTDSPESSSYTHAISW